jgi:hypothetical protein
VTSIVTGILILLVLAAFGYSAVRTLYTVLMLVHIEHGSIISKIRPPDDGATVDLDTGKMLKEYVGSLTGCMYVFSAAFGMAATLILINLFHKHLPVM